MSVRGLTRSQSGLRMLPHHESILRIGKMLKQRLGLDPNITIGFNVHHEEKNKPAAVIKQKFHV